MYSIRLADTKPQGICRKNIRMLQCYPPLSSKPDWPHINNFVTSLNPHFSGQTSEGELRWLLSLNNTRSIWKLMTSTKSLDYPVSKTRTSKLKSLR